jgi:hypothetical protein
MQPTANPSSDKQDALGCRIERDIIGVLLGLVVLAALWWAGTWWWRAGHAEAAPAPRPPTLETANPPAPPLFDRRRALTQMLQGIGAPGADAGAMDARAHTERRAARMSYGPERGHGSESWSRSGAPERQDFEPRYSLDAGTFAEPAPVAVEAPSAFH